MKVEIVTEGRLIDIIKEGFDAGVRLAEAVSRDMIAMPLGPHTRHVVVGAPSYFANRPRPHRAGRPNESLMHPHSLSQRRSLPLGV